ncbi:CLUMA_CG016823, isoform A [Clunio marinus]|uniref:CLUMA_CG016823, isoform A n=1 Tax=Clunio marinus TaxID=568069 RepID=A0A1J1IW40_9DIPT|nr:CLUMA_CG016823, isoform A [Clunio marinus]
MSQKDFYLHINRNQKHLMAFTLPLISFFSFRILDIPKSNTINRPHPESNTMRLLIEYNLQKLSKQQNTKHQFTHKKYVYSDEPSTSAQIYVLGSLFNLTKRKIGERGGKKSLLIFLMLIKQAMHGDRNLLQEKAHERQQQQQHWVACIVATAKEFSFFFYIRNKMETF